MRAYVASTGVIFALIVLLHLWRGFVEGPALLLSPWFIAITLLAAGLGVWAWRLLRDPPA
jgi:ABC-type proline/glycine betaine transport system permease subunit